MSFGGWALLTSANVYLCTSVCMIYAIHSTLLTLDDIVSIGGAFVAQAINDGEGGDAVR